MVSYNYLRRFFYRLLVVMAYTRRRIAEYKITPPAAPKGSFFDGKSTWSGGLYKPPKLGGASSDDYEIAPEGWNCGHLAHPYQKRSVLIDLSAKRTSTSRSTTQVGMVFGGNIQHLFKSSYIHS